MSSLVRDILDEWEGGCFYNDKRLSEAYTQMLLALLDASAEDRADPRIVPFLLVGYLANRQHDSDPHAKLTYRMALAMVGQGSVEPPPTPPKAPQPQAPQANPEPQSGPSRPRSPSPQPGPSRPRSPSPQPGDKRPREEEDVEQPTLEVLQTRERHLKRFNTTFREEVALIKGLGDSIPSEQLMEEMFDTMLARQRDAVQAKDDDRVILEIENSLNSENPVWFSLRRVDQINGRVVVDKLARVLNSNQAFMSDGQLKISYIHVQTPDEGGRRADRVPNESMDQWLDRMESKKTIFSPNNTDNMCLTRSVAVAMARHSMSKMPFSRFKKNEGAQKKVAQKLCDDAQIDSTKPCGIDEVQKLQDSLPGYRLCVFTDKRGKECVYKTPYTAGRINIYLLLHKEHFSAILYPCQAFETKFDCPKCVTFFNTNGPHHCVGSCWRCFGATPHDDPSIPLIRCPDCNHQFSGDECMQTHKNVKLQQSSFTKCEAFQFCLKCKKSYSAIRGQTHICTLVHCKYCKHQVPENHLCYMTSWGEREKRKKWSYVTIYWDLETTQHTPVEGKSETFEHKPNLLVSQAVCDDCVNTPQNNLFCPVCKTRQNIFHNLDNPELCVMSQFFDYLQSFGSKTEIMLVAHNAKAFDSIFALQEVVARKLQCAVTLAGAKIICMKVGNWKFVDSLMFMPMALSAMPKAFGLTELKKGYWPFMANKPEFYDYEGPLLSKDMYCISTMKSKAAAEFHAWYAEQIENNYVFNFRKEFTEYCISDVTILRHSCSHFRKLFEEVAGFDPMFNCITLSSACMAAFRRNFLQKETIGIVPPGGYHGRGKQSHIALQWLDFESHKLGQTIKTIYTDREVSVMGRRVDGYAEVPLPDGTVERRIYQFHGDFWHQCPEHFPLNENTPEDKYANTMRITALFREAGYKVIEKWECAFNRDLKSDPATKAYFEQHPTSRVTPLNLRDALCGGRTSALRWYHKADLEKGEKIKMVDVISEYPNANLRGEYPYGHPTLYMEGDPNTPPVDQWNGVAKCTVLPPRDLFIPVLPYKAKDRLMFPLCRSCTEQGCTEICKHPPEERQLTDTWCAPELHLALEKGYVISKVHEVYQYPGTSQYNPQTHEDGLLSAYVRCFMALKIQASGWPPECTTDELKDQFIKDTLEFDGVTLDPAKIAKNPALRTLAKLMCNSFWGKFGEKSLRPQTELIYDLAKFMTLLAEPVKTITGLLPLAEECLQVKWEPIEDTEESLPTSSLIHAAFTTCLGRLQLYKYLDVVDKRALYHDTDSVAYISRPGQPDLPTGTHLGDLTDQVEEDYGSGSFIVEFCAGGPKNYAYKVAVGGDPLNIEVCIKVRGISINNSCDKLVTFDNLKAMVWGDKDKFTVPIPHQIVRLPNWQVQTRSTRKDWRPVNTKRRRVDVANTVPHGYNEWSMADDEDQGLLEAMDLCADA